MMSIAANIQAIRARMDAAAARAGRDPGEILLVGEIGRASCRERV